MRMRLFDLEYPDCFLPEKGERYPLCIGRGYAACSKCKVFADFDEDLDESVVNPPLSLEELREMDGEPVWVANSSAKKKDGFCNEWALISVSRKDAESVGTIYHFENYGDYWLAYRRKLEGDKDNVVQISRSTGSV